MKKKTQNKHTFKIKATNIIKIKQNKQKKKNGNKNKKRRKKKIIFKKT